MNNQTYDRIADVSDRRCDRFGTIQSVSVLCRAERLRLNSYLMCNNCNSGVIQVEPGGNLPISDDEDVSHPGGMSLYGA